jgi:hypothetical protein
MCEVLAGGRAQATIRLPAVVHRYGEHFVRGQREAAAATVVVAAACQSDMPGSRGGTEEALKSLARVRRSNLRELHRIARFNK